MKRGLNKEQGSALLIVMVVISVIATLSLAVIQLALMSSRAVARTEDGINAQLAAMAGIEDSLLRWKFNRNTEAPQKNSFGECTTSPYEESDRFDRIVLGLDGQQDSSVGGPNSCILKSVAPRSDSMVYDVKISHRLKKGASECVRSSKSISVPGLPTCPSAPGENAIALKKDQIAEYNVQGLSNISLKWGVRANSYVGLENVALEIVSLGDSCLGQDKICNKQVYQNPLTSSANFSSGGGEILRIKIFGADLDYYALSAGDNNYSLDTRFTTIDSTGYYGGVQRRLRLTLDRLTGQALPIYDFALFSGSSGIQDNSQ